MILNQYYMLKKMFFCTLLLTASTNSFVFARELVDLNGHHNRPLGEVIESKAGDQAYFSLGNGRPIKVSLVGTSIKEKEILR